MADAFNAADGTRISFEEAGEGPALLLVHGSGLSRAIWRGFGYVKALRGSYRVITVDLRGHGRSDKPHREQDYRMELVVGDLLAVLDAAGVDAAHLLGYSFGARVGFSLADSHPERMLSFVSAGGTHRPLAGQIERVFFPGYDQAISDGGMAEFVRRWGEASGRPVDPQTAAAFQANDPAALQAYFRQSESEPGVPEDRLERFALPVLLLAGTEDHPRARDSRIAADLIPGAAFRALAGRNHGTTLVPADEVLEAVLPFLERAGKGLRVEHMFE